MNARFGRLGEISADFMRTLDRRRIPVFKRLRSTRDERMLTMVRVVALVKAGFEGTPAMTMRRIGVSRPVPVVVGSYDAASACR